MNVIKSLPLYLVFSSIRIFPEDSDRGMAIIVLTGDIRK